MLRMEGELERITYYNQENDFTVARLKPVGENNLVTVVGHLPPLRPGEYLRLEGDWEKTPKYGAQFKVSSLEVVLPKTLKGIERYLGSGAVKGIGPTLAGCLVEYFGEEVLEVMDKEPHRLQEVKGIGQKKAAVIARSYEEQKDIREVMIFLQDYEVSPALAARIYRHYGKEAVTLVQENPYRLASEVMGIGFKTADKIAIKMGVDFFSPQRIKAAYKYVLWEAAGQGHVFLPRGELFGRLQELFSGEGAEIQEGLLEGQLGALVEEKEVFLEEGPQEQGTLVYLAPFYYGEKGVAARLLELKHAHSRGKQAGDAGPGKRPGQGPPGRERGPGGLELAPGQEEALVKAREAGILIITGGPGTGKTTTIKALINLFEEDGLRVSLAAPTGRAARRMAEAAGREARTIHRLLEYSFTGRGMAFLRNEEKPLETDALVVDEMSMVDLLLMYHLLKALPPGCRLVLVGDMDQLPSVGAGNVLRGLISSGVLPVVTLDTIFRQARESLIVVNAHRVNRGMFPVTNQRERDFFFIPEEDPEKVGEIILGLCRTRIPGFMKVEPVEDIQVITPMRRTGVGVEALNRQLQESLNPPGGSKKELFAAGQLFRLGDKVMQVKNNYQKEIYNGDIGRVVDIDLEGGEVTVRFPELQGYRLVKYKLNEMEELVLSYAISVHKSQGSEYPVVVMPVVTQHYMLLQRNLIYTAITRARQLVVMVGTKKALGIALRNNRVEERYSLLRERLLQGVDKHYSRPGSPPLPASPGVDPGQLSLFSPGEPAEARKEKRGGPGRGGELDDLEKYF